MSSPQPLTKKRQEWARSRGGAVFYGKPLTYPSTTEARYQATLEHAVAPMIAETEAMVAALWASNSNKYAMDATPPDMVSQARILTNALSRKFFAHFDKIAQPAAEALYVGVNKHSTANLHASLKGVTGGLSLKTSVISGKVATVTKAGIVENVGLIKSIPRQYFPKIQQAVFRSMTTGQGTKTVLEAVRAIGHSTEKRARLIARDQTSKATTSLNAARMEALGVKKFHWLHSYGGKVPRPLHKNGLNGNVYELANPPVIDDKTGERGLPGQLINCRCRMGPVVDFGPPVEAAPVVTPPPKPKPPPKAPAPSTAAPFRLRAKPKPEAPPFMTPAEETVRETVVTLGKRGKVEFLTAQDETGRVIVAPYSGKARSVGFSQEFLDLVNDPYRRIVAHHNHPGSSSLSPQDIREATRRPGMAKLWAHGHDGSSYGAERAAKYFEVADADVAAKTVNARFTSLINLGEKIDVKDVNRVYSHVVNLILHKKGLFKYSYQLSGPTEEAAKRLAPYIDKLLGDIAS